MFLFLFVQNQNVFAGFETQNYMLTTFKDSKNNKVFFEHFLKKKKQTTLSQRGHRLSIEKIGKKIKIFVIKASSAISISMSTMSADWLQNLSKRARIEYLQANPQIKYLSWTRKVRKHIRFAPNSNLDCSFILNDGSVVDRREARKM